MPTPAFRRPLAAAGLLAGLLAVTAADPSVAAVPDDSVGRVLKADVAFLQKNLADAKAAKWGSPLRGVALNVAAYAAASKDAVLLEQANKVLAALAGKKPDVAAALSVAKAMAPKGGAGGKLDVPAGVTADIHDVMNVFALERSGGQNIDKDLKTQSKAVTDVALAELIAARSAAAGVYTLKAEVEFDAGKKTKAKWEKWSQDMITASEKAAAEAAKGAKANKADVAKSLSSLLGSCNACHEVFRD